MIPIKHIGDMSAYDAFIDNFKKDLKQFIKNRYIGNRGSIEVKDVIKTYDNLSDDLKGEYLKKLDYKNFDDVRHLDLDLKIRAPKRFFSDSEIQLLEKLKDDLDRIAYASADKLKDIIADYQKEFKLDKKGKIDKAEDKYQTVQEVFVDKGYGKDDFKETVWKVTNLRVCPYCNRTYIPLISWATDKSAIKGQLDHFYPKDTYPYLAISFYNLIPSCTYCNGTSCKGSKDPLVENIVSPYSLKDHKGLRFRIKKFDKGVLDLDKCADSIELGIDTSLNADMRNNNRIFKLLKIYSFHKDIAAEVLFKHKAIMKTPYIGFLQDITRASVSASYMKDFLKLYWGVPLEEDKLGDRPMSKFTLDLIHDLNENHK